MYLFRHTDAMIRKLEEAGLGYYIRPTSAQEKLGTPAMLIVS